MDSLEVLEMKRLALLVLLCAAVSTMSDGNHAAAQSLDPSPPVLQLHLRTRSDYLPNPPMPPPLPLRFRAGESAVLARYRAARAECGDFGTLNRLLSEAVPMKAGSKEWGETRVAVLREMDKCSDLRAVLRIVIAFYNRANSDPGPDTPHKQIADYEQGFEDELANIEGHYISDLRTLLLREGG